MITDCGSTIEACGAFDNIIDNLWEKGFKIGQRLRHQTTQDINMVAIYRGDKEPRGFSLGSGDKVIWLIITTCNVMFAIFLLQYKAPAEEPCINNLRSSKGVSINPIIQPKNQTQLPFYLARSQSFGFFYDITNDQWRLYQSIYNEHVDHRYPEKKLTFNPEGTAQNSDPVIWSRRNNHKYGYHSYAAWWQNNYEPNFSCAFEKRVGVPMNGDGPKWVCDPHRIKKLAEARKEEDPDSRGCVVYSIGSSGDYTFELGMQKEVGVGTCEYHIFDFGDYENKMPKELERAYYHRWGLKKQTEGSWFGGKPSEGKQYYGLLDTIKLLGHEDLDVIDIFVSIYI